MAGDSGKLLWGLRSDGSADLGVKLIPLSGTFHTDYLSCNLLKSI